MTSTTRAHLAALLYELQRDASISVLEGAMRLLVASIRYSCLDATCDRWGSLGARERSEHVLQRWLEFAKDASMMKLSRTAKDRFEMSLCALVCPAIDSKPHAPRVIAAIDVSFEADSVAIAWMSFGCEHPTAHRVQKQPYVKPALGTWHLCYEYTLGSETGFWGIHATELAAYLCDKLAVGAVLRP
jgi:hypothetical protein